MHVCVLHVILSVVCGCVIWFLGCGVLVLVMVLDCSVGWVVGNSCVGGCAQGWVALVMSVGVVALC